jgi:hypothetical protein
VLELLTVLAKVIADAVVVKVVFAPSVTASL